MKPYIEINYITTVESVNPTTPLDIIETISIETNVTKPLVLNKLLNLETVHDVVFHRMKKSYPKTLATHLAIECLKSRKNGRTRV